jgi:hypothetical protein
MLSHFVFSLVILCFPLSFCVFLCHFVRHMGGGGRSTDGRGAGHRMMRCSMAGTRGAEEAGALVGEAMGGGGRGAHR